MIAVITAAARRGIFKHSRNARRNARRDGVLLIITGPWPSGGFFAAAAADVPKETPPPLFLPPLEGFVFSGML